MKALILAAGKGTRLKPLTDNIPKALVPVAGIPMIDYVIKNLINAGINNIAVNLHHLGNYIKNYLPQKYPKVNFYFSDENDKLLDTGGAIKKLSAFLRNDNKPFIVHNVDILTNLNLTDLINFHIKSNNTVTIAVKNRNTSRYLL
ncbi:MAG TPA: nucleotidyltransferase family protein, partial [Bacteroidales bacterium]|nr:nucleotidyltransferase family protein [Bacteroidales bacterium]